MLLKDMFVGASQPKIPKQKDPPSTASAQVKEDEFRARQRMAGAMGRGSTVIAGSNLGNVG